MYRRGWLYGLPLEDGQSLFGHLLITYLTATRTKYNPIILFTGWMKITTNFLISTFRSYRYYQYWAYDWTYSYRKGSLELELNRSKSGTDKKSSISLPLVILAFSLAYLLQYYGGYSFRDSLINAIPLCDQ
jgi:hypothetical protein